MRDQRLETALDKFADKLMEIRLERKLTHEKLGKKAGLHWTTIGLVERKKRRPSILTCMKIAHALGFRLTDLLDDIEPPPR